MEKERHHQPLLYSLYGCRNGFAGMLQWEAAGLVTALAAEEYVCDQRFDIKG